MIKTRCINLGKRNVSDKSCNENQNTPVTILDTLLSLKLNWTVRVSTNIFPHTVHLRLAWVLQHSSLFPYTVLTDWSVQLRRGVLQFA